MATVIDEEVESVCKGTSYEEKIKRVKTEITEKEKYVCVSTLLLELSCTFVVFSEMGTVQGSKAFFQHALIKARESKKCPLCARGYDTQEGLDNLISSVSIYLHAHVQYMYITAYYMQQVLHVHCMIFKNNY